METFTPPIEPSISNLTKQTKTRTLVADFGDGYTQRAGDGLNAIQRSYSLTWNGLSVADADTIEDFFEARRGFESFEWTAPREASPRKWIVQEWSRQHLAFDVDAINAALVEVFDL